MLERKIGDFTYIAQPCKVDDQPMIGVWSDGCGFYSDNGHSPMMHGICREGHAPCEVKLVKGKKYRIQVFEIKE